MSEILFDLSYDSKISDMRWDDGEEQKNCSRSSSILLTSHHAIIFLFFSVNDTQLFLFLLRINTNRSIERLENVRLHVHMLLLLAAAAVDDENKMNACRWRATTNFVVDLLIFAIIWRLQKKSNCYCVLWHTKNVDNASFSFTWMFALTFLAV